jgi:hypothetical protein
MSGIIQEETNGYKVFVWGRKSLYNVLYSNLINGTLFKRIFELPNQIVNKTMTMYLASTPTTPDDVFFVSMNGENIRIATPFRKKFVDDMIKYKGWFSKFEDINKIKVFSKVKDIFSYAALYGHNNNIIRLVIENAAAFTKLSNNATIGVKYEIQDNMVIINNLDIISHYILSKILDIPSWKLITGQDINYVKSFLEIEPKYISEYIDQNIEEYPNFLELTINDATYVDVLITYGLKYTW